MKKKIIIIVILLAISGLAITFIKNFQDNKQVTEKTKIKITSEYKKLEQNINNYNGIRDNIETNLNDYYTEKLTNDYNTYIDLLTKEENTIKQIETNIDNIKNDCQNRIFNEKEVNNICNTYKDYYETVVNIFIKDKNQVNKMITTYNNTTNNTLKEYTSNTYNDFIDYNEDRIYLERD